MTGKEVLLQQLLTQADSSPAMILYSFFPPVLMQGCFDWQSSNTPKWDSARRATSQTTSKVVEFQWNCLDIVQFHCSSAEHIHKKKKYQGEKYEQI